jgi:dihydrodipicolinate synthase/N-acetylneuraminate lyase
MLIEGIFAAVPTPFYPDEKIYYRKLEANMVRYSRILLAEENQQRIVAASQRIIGQLGLCGIKYACDMNGYYGGRPRAPLLTVTGTEKKEIEGLLAEIRN